MALEQRLRDELSRSAARIHSETDAVLAQVVVTARRRQRARRAGAALLLAGLVIACAVGIPRLNIDTLGRQPEPATESTDPIVPAGSPYHHDIRNAVNGMWQSRPLPIQAVREAIKAAGFSSADADRVIGNAHRWQVQVLFQYQGLIAKTWDPSNLEVLLQTDDAQPYKLLPHHRLMLMPVRSPYDLMFSYRIIDDRLVLHYLRASPHPLPSSAAARILAWTAAPLFRVS